MSDCQISSSVPRFTCRNCGGKKWFPSAIGLIGCQVCDATGKGAVDVEKIVAEWKWLKARVVEFERQLEVKQRTDNVSDAIAFGKGLGR